jgi:outer membrane lipoprotein SlyB
MKLAFVLASICCALLLGGCADQSLMTDEEYAASKGPAPHSPDYSSVLPRKSSTMNPGY